MIASAVAWYLILTALGWMVFPVAFRLLPGLTDRGFAFSRTLGLLLTGYVFWLLASLGLLHNSTGGMMFAAVVVLVISLTVYFRFSEDTDSILEWVTTNQRMIILTEVVVLGAFIGWSVVRAYNPHIFYTEKPMELAFLNGVRTSPGFPPRDPWLSGYAISYYYFGYVLIALLADLSGTMSGVAFNLGIATLFTLTVSGAFGLIFNLISASKRPDRVGVSGYVFSFLGPVFIAIMGNLAGVLELLRTQRFVLLSDKFWKWLDIIRMDALPDTALWPPAKWEFWWWFRASRVINDRNPAGVSVGIQPIDEFPFFSFLLGDMHPHVLALPFVVMALGFAFNALNQQNPLNKRQYPLYILMFGGLAFLNTWDLPIYLFVLAGALVLRAIRERGWFELRDVYIPALMSIGLIAAGIAAYLPWYLSFGSQAGGVLPNALFATPIQQYLVIFGPFLLIIVWFLARLIIDQYNHVDWISGITFAVGLLLILITLDVAFSLIALRGDPAVQAFVVQSTGLAVENMTPEQVSQAVQPALKAVINHRLAHPVTPLLLTALMTAVIAIIAGKYSGPGSTTSSDDSATHTTSVYFVLLLILTGLMLTIGPEFLYLRDNFSMRINTIFKFYFASWILFGAAAAYASYFLISRLSRIRKNLFVLALAVAVASGLTYTVLAIPAISRDSMRAATDSPPTLDGLADIRQRAPDEYAAIMWLSANAAEDDIIVEAVTGSYSVSYNLPGNRVSALTGIPTVLGWPGHESQWRGQRYTEFAGGREMDVREIYNTTSMPRALELLNKYSVTYIYVGSQERDPAWASPAGLQKFQRYLRPVFSNDTVTIYRTDLPLVQEAP